MKTLNIAIDGPAGAGKSTIAKIIASKMGIIYLDTGAMYRAAALKCIRERINTKEPDSVRRIVDLLDIKVIFSDNEQRILLDNEDVTALLRTKEVTTASSDVAVVPEIRKKLVELQRKIATENSVIMDGRDIGSYVLPEASFKFFLTASVEERTKRRYKELMEKGMSGTTFEDVYKDIIYRDKNDSSRDFAPLIKAKDAVEVDTTNMNIEQVADEILKIVGTTNV